MLQRTLDLPPAHVYPVEPWRLVEREFYPRRLAQFETLFSTANGYLGMRGSPDEGEPAHDDATLVNGFHETWPIVYAERAFGFARTGQTLVAVPDARRIQLYVDDEPFYLPSARLLAYERALDMRAGLLERECLWETPAGKVVSIRSRRLVSLEERHLAAIDYEVTVLNAEAPVVIVSELAYRPGPRRPGTDGDPRVARVLSGRVLRPERSEASGRRLLLAHRTERSGMVVACGAEHLLDTACPHTWEVSGGGDRARAVLTVEARPAEPIRLTKLVAYHTSARAGPEELCERVGHGLRRAVGRGFGALLESQRRRLEEFWGRCDVQIAGAGEVEADEEAASGATLGERLQQVMRLNLFHMLQATARAEDRGVPAKGLTGLGYEGHYFWDTEIYVLPFLVYTDPRLARNLLEVRYAMLDAARTRAREVNQRGALFPWRTISGEEASAYYAAGTAQYHIDADVVYALRQYVRATGDEQFLYEQGAEILVETARLWRDLGFFSDAHGGRFCISGVTGPDEYNTVVNNNTFTNLMARENLWYAADTVEHMRQHRPERYAALAHRTGLEPDEVAGWREAANRMVLAFDPERGIHLQDDEFLDKKPWDFAGTPPDHYPLLLHYHPLVIYRHRVIKQADVVLAMFLLGDEFSAEQKRRNFDFYDPLTTGDSSLSVCVQAIVALEIGRDDVALEYARYAALMDFADLAGNVRDGCHIASMGGTWMLAVHGFGGFRDHGGCFSFRPRLPAPFGRLAFTLTLRGQLLDVEITHRAVTYRLRQGTGLTLWHEDEELRLSEEAPEQSRPGPAAASESGPARAPAERLRPHGARRSG